MANREKEKVPFNKEAFKAVLDYRKISIRKLCSVSGGISWSGKTIARAMDAGKVSPDLLDEIGKYLNVDPDFFSQKHWVINNTMIDKSPYFLKSLRNTTNEQYDNAIELLLKGHNVLMSEYEKMDNVKQLEFILEIEKAVGPIIEKYFPKNCFGEKNDNWLNIDNIENAIYDEIISGMSEDVDTIVDGIIEITSKNGMSIT